MWAITNERTWDVSGFGPGTDIVLITHTRTWPYMPFHSITQIYVQVTNLGKYYRRQWQILQQSQQCCEWVAFVHRLATNIRKTIALSFLTKQKGISIKTRYPTWWSPWMYKPDTQFQCLHILRRWAFNKQVRKGLNTVGCV